MALSTTCVFTSTDWHRNCTAASQGVPRLNLGKHSSWNCGSFLRESRASYSWRGGHLSSVKCTKGVNFILIWENESCIGGEWWLTRKLPQPPSAVTAYSEMKMGGWVTLSRLSKSCLRSNIVQERSYECQSQRSVGAASSIGQLAIKVIPGYAALMAL